MPPGVRLHSGLRLACCLAPAFNTNCRVHCCLLQAEHHRKEGLWHLGLHLRSVDERSQQLGLAQH